MKRIIAKVLTFTVLWTSLITSFAQVSYAAPGTRTVIEDDYIITYEQEDYDIAKSDWDYDVIDAPPAISSSVGTQSEETYVDGKWQTVETPRVEWTNGGFLPEDQSSFSNNQIGKNWTEVERTKISTPVQGEVQNKDKAYVPEAIVGKSSVDIESIKADASVAAPRYSAANFNTPTMQAAAVAKTFWDHVQKRTKLEVIAFMHCKCLVLRKFVPLCTWFKSGTCGT